ncbi:MAG: class I SAM-dependent methyltransferase [Thermoleophilia bacterium]|nr:class I SAM-dependent methyltransferase [Thermoleophilia bacterium]
MPEPGWDEAGMYGALAGWWPLISPPEEYAEEAAYVAGLLAAHDRPVRDVLELGSGGGHNAVHLSAGLAMTLVDRSPGMLAQSRLLNPGCRHEEGDMRTVRLGREFDGVLVHDAVDYMRTRGDLAAAAGTAAAHLRPGGLAVFVPDHTAERYAPSTDHGGIDAADGRGARYLAWSWDPDPGDTESVTDYVMVLRERDGTVTTVHDRHRTGLFPRAVWLEVLAGAGLEARAVDEVTTEARPPREVFLGRRPG